MGPQPLSRGNDLFFGGTVIRHLTSMGPQPLSRGNWTTRQGLRILRTNFNGAATSQSRKLEFMATSNEETGTSMGPQPLSRGNPSSGDVLEVLRTHFNGAATSQSRKRPWQPSNSTTNCVLQWGRNLSVAETSPRTGRGARWRNFNGAATSQSRKLAAGDVHLLFTVTSMGPQPLSRGNTINSQKVTLTDLKLQWGRNLSVAETGRVDLDGDAIGATSMGPQPLSRGNCSGTR